MMYLFIQTWLWILGAGLLGLVIGWLIWGKKSSPETADLEELKRELTACRSKYAKLEAISKAREENQEHNERNARTAIEVPPEAAVQSDLISTSSVDVMRSENTEATQQINGDGSGVEEAWKPSSLPGPEGDADDLKRVKGIGPVIERKLNELGIYHFHQVGALTEENIRWVNHHIAFPGRIQREGWVEQSKKLAEGEGSDVTKS